MKILYLLSSYNLYGGTPKRILDLIKGVSLEHECVLYVWSQVCQEEKVAFERTGATIYEGYYGRNVFKHLTDVLRIIDIHHINIIHTQFSFGEGLGWLIKVFRPKVKLVIAFEAPFSPAFLKYFFVKHFYQKADAFVYISKYVKQQKELQFKILGSKHTCVIYNSALINWGCGDDTDLTLDKPSLLSVSSLIDWKNHGMLLDALYRLVYKQGIGVYLYIAGDGVERNRLTAKISKYKLDHHVFLLGNRKDVPALLKRCDVFVHPSYAEGFGLAVAEAMLAGKPIIVSDAGALPELIENRVSGLIVNPYHSDEWADAIIEMLNSDHSEHYAKNAQLQALERFSNDRYVSEYKALYHTVLNNSAS